MLRRLPLALAVVVTVVVTVCAATTAAGKTLDERIDDILAKMSTAQKLAQLHRTETWYTADDPALGIPGFHLKDGPHGIGWHNATCFPVTAAMAATWDDDLVRRIGEAIGREFRAKGFTQALAPTVDVIRDPRAGRNPESPSEDPFLAARVSAAFVRGMQSTTCIATGKHLELETRQANRHHLRPVVDDRTLFEFYSPPFRVLAQEAGVWSIMNAYNFLNGERCAESRHLLTEILRDQWGYFFYVISDWGSVYDAKRAIEAGTDLEMATHHFENELPDLLAEGSVKMATLDLAVRRVLRTKLVSGLIDGQPLANLHDIDSPAHRLLAREAAAKSIVLLKNENKTLPIELANTLSVAVIGPSAAVARLDGVGSSMVTPYYTVSPLEGIQKRAGARFAIGHAHGCDIQGDDTSGFAEAVALAKDASVVVYVGGLDESMEGEERDRRTGSIDLPGVQCKLIEALAAVNPKLVVVLEGGGAIGVSACVESIPALLYAIYPGQEGGNAIADVLFGDVNPSGKLPYTIPRNDAQLPPWDLDHTRDLIDGRGYRWFDRQGLEPQFPFGHGLSYTTFKYSPVRIQPVSSTLGEEVAVSVDVTNTGQRAGDEVVQLYVRDEPTSKSAAPKVLRGFERIHLAPGATATVRFTVGVEDLWHYDTKAGAFAAEPGFKVVLVGTSSRVLESRAFVVAPSPPRPDLVVSYLAWVPPYPEPGEPVSFLAMIRNRGHGASPAGVAHELAIQVDGKPVARSVAHTAAIRPGEAVMLQATNLGPQLDWSPPTPRPFEVRATINPTATITESITSNNGHTATLLAYPHNLAERRPARASAFDRTGTEAALAVDARISTQWSSGAADPQHLTIDLGQLVDINRVVLSWDFAFAHEYRIQIGDDGDSWADLHVEAAGDGAIDEIAVTGRGRYVRMYATGRAVPWGYGLWEFQVYGEPVPASP